MKTRLFARMLLLSGLVAFGSAANASDELAGALFGAGTGAVIGNAIDHHDGAVVGGILGAILGAAIADDDDRRPVGRRPYLPPVVHPAPRPIYGPAPVVVYPAPPRYFYPPAFVEYRQQNYGWPKDRYERHDRYDRHDGRWERDREHEERGNRRGW